MSSTLTGTAPITGSAMYMRLAVGLAQGLPVPSATTIVEPDEAFGGHATLSLRNNDRPGVVAWLESFQQAGAVVTLAPHLDRRIYEATGGRGSFRMYRAAVESDGWRIGVQCVVTS